jgi:hypothetical protein
MRQRHRALVLLMIVMLAFAVRSLTANFVRAHFNDPAWFQAIAYAIFDKQAQAFLNHQEPIFFITDRTRTDRIIYPPLYPLWVALVYGISGDRSPAPVQRIQLVLDSLSVLLIVGIGTTAFGWTIGVAGGLMAAISPLLAVAGATPNADAPTSWAVLGGVWLLLLAARKQKVLLALAAGAILGIGCWLRVNPVLLCLCWMVALPVFVKSTRRRRLALGGAAALSTLLVIAPVVVRNLVVFYPDFVPTGLSVGLNLWEGIGEMDRGPEFGAPSSDVETIEQDRKEMGLPADAFLQINYPDGIRRDRERGRKAFAVIKAHPIWYLGTTLLRLSRHFKYAGDPPPHIGSAGFNVTSRKCLATAQQGGPLAFAVNLLGYAQSITRYLVLPLILIGVAIALRRDWRTTGVIMATVLYYMGTLAVGHSEIRYGLPMQALLLVFAGVAICSIAAAARQIWQKSQSRRAGLSL